MIKTLVYDVGNVLTYWKTRAICSSIFDNEEDAEICYQQGFCSPLWYIGDSGASTMEGLAKMMGEGKDEKTKAIIKKGLTTYQLHLIPNAKAIAFLKAKHREGFPTYLLSNYSEMFPVSMHTLGVDLEKDVDGYVYSHKEKVCKPDLKIYLILAERYHLDLSTCLFIDDRQENLDGAKKAGFGYTFLFEDNLEQLAEFIKKNS